MYGSADAAANKEKGAASPFSKLQTTQASQAEAHHKQRWASLNTKQHEDDQQTEPAKRDRYSQEQIKWLKEGLHHTMDKTFDKAYKDLTSSYLSNNAEAFMECWTNCFEDAILQHTATPHHLHKRYKGRNKVNIQQKQVPCSGQHNTTTNTITTTQANNTSQEHDRLCIQIKRLQNIRDIARLLHRHLGAPANSSVIGAEGAAAPKEDMASTTLKPPFVNTLAEHIHSYTQRFTHTTDMNNEPEQEASTSLNNHLQQHKWLGLHTTAARAIQTYSKQTDRLEAQARHQTRHQQTQLYSDHNTGQRAINKAIKQ